MKKDSKVCLSHQHSTFYVQNGLKQGDVFLSASFSFALK